MTGRWKRQTLAARSHTDGRRVTRPLGTPIQQTTTFQVATSEEQGRMLRARDEGIYPRFGHPTPAAVAEKVAQLEGAEAALLFSSGMAAITTSLLTVLRPGDHVVCQREIFGQTFTFLDEMARSFGIEVDFVDATRPEAVAGAIGPNTRLIYAETPSNPLLRVIDLAALADLAQRHDLALAVDSTFASPWLQNPIELGADLVLHSGTKYLAGHSDVMCGVAVASAALISAIKETQILLGGVLDPHASWLMLRGLRTLGVRVERQCQTALALARFLEGHPAIRQVHYPFLESSPFFELASRQMRGGGGVVSFEVAGGLDEARAFVDSLELIPIATSLGGVESLIEIPMELDFSEAELGSAAHDTGISPGLIRLSVGLEDLADLQEDLERGLEAVQALAASGTES
ncbi:MAG: aminotransferase class I/II-fold pyridoxal phosphate-dependent enzyme [Acidobacteria bacterium]|nr:aminotransferase class I/II-fold pyridoxal phosphate-dependent enzyme [Acidobacteriota bacterium]